MTDPIARVHRTPSGDRVDPFPAGDPLVYEELSPAMVALRALLATLAYSGATAAFPAHLAPSALAVEVASGWLLRPTVTTDADTGQVLLSCVWQGLPTFSPAGQS